VEALQLTKFTRAGAGCRHGGWELGTGRLAFSHDLQLYPPVSLTRLNPCEAAQMRRSSSGAEDVNNFTLDTGGQPVDVAPAPLQLKS